MESEELNKLLPRFWDIDVIGVTDRDHSIDRTLNDFQESVKYNRSDRRYIVRLPWKQNKHELPDNYHLSNTRLISLIKNLEKKDSGLIYKYDSQIQDQIKLDFIEEVVGHFDTKFYFLSKVATLSRVPPPSGITLIGALYGSGS